MQHPRCWAPGSDHGAPGCGVHVRNRPPNTVWTGSYVSQAVSSGATVRTTARRAPSDQRIKKRRPRAKSCHVRARGPRRKNIRSCRTDPQEPRPRNPIRDRGCRAAGARLRGTGAGRANRRTGRPRRGTRHGHRAVAHTGISNTTPAHASPTRKLHADSAYWGSRSYPASPASMRGTRFVVLTRRRPRLRESILRAAPRPRPPHPPHHPPPPPHPPRWE